MSACACGWSGELSATLLYRDGSRNCPVCLRRLPAEEAAEPRYPLFSDNNPDDYEAEQPDDADSLIERIERALDSDIADRTANSEQMIATYLSQNDATRAVIDDLFTSLCGYKLQTLIDNTRTDDTDEGESTDDPTAY